MTATPQIVTTLAASTESLRVEVDHLIAQRDVLLTTMREITSRDPESTATEELCDLARQAIAIVERR